MLEFIIEWSVPITLLILGYIFGFIAEKQHYISLNKREQEKLNVPLVTFDETKLPENIEFATLSIGSVVISTDYFKRFLAYLRSIFGGRVGSYETLVDRARREALLRMVEQQPGAHMFVNVRLETSSVFSSGQGKQPIASVEAIAYGTALYLSNQQ